MAVFLIKNDYEVFYFGEECVLKITHLKTNRITNPLGFELQSISLSWVTSDTLSQKQKWARVQVSDNPDFSNILWDSGEDSTISSVDCPLRIETLPRTRYWWRVTVCGDTGDIASSEPAWFETGKQEELWQGKWITIGQDSHIHPLFRRSFTLKEEPQCARIYATGLGLYELSVNGQKAGDEHLAPGCTAYDKCLQYQTYDVTAMLHKGQNTLGAMMGNGWAIGRFGLGGYAGNYETGDLGTPCHLFSDQFLFLLELHVTLADGQEIILGTDENWQWASSPITFSGIYDGERYEQAKEIPGWDTPEADNFPWHPVQAAILDRPVAKPSARLSLPVRRHETFRPSLLHTEKDEWVLDMGQEITGGFLLDSHLPKGTTLRLQFGELLQDGCFYRDNMRTALCEYRYLSNGRPEVIHPFFTFYGYRYIKVEGWPGGKPDETAFTGYSLYSDLEEIGTLKTGHPKVNRLILNAKWSQKDNFVDVPTDCPQRDERMGWTGDAQIFSSTACFLMDCAAFYDKYCRDMWKEQEIRGGCNTHVAPYLSDFGDGDQGACGWADAAVIVPWNTYVYNGGKEKLREHFPGMKAWIDWVRQEDASTGNTHLWLAKKFHYGDWLALDGPRYGLDAEAVLGGTDVTFLCSVYYYRCAQIVSKAAGVLGMEAEQKEYAELAEEIRTAIHREYFTPTGRCAAATQTGLVLALKYGLVPSGFEKKNLEALQSMLHDSQMHLRTGFLGTPVLCRALSQYGDNDSAYTLLLQEDFPSWLYEINMGATTIWERWNALLPNGKISGTGMNSMNHYAYGSIVEWMYRDMCGINPCEEAPGFQRITLAPKPDKRMGYAFATVDSPAGRYQSGWKWREDTGFSYDFSIPFNCEGELCLMGTLNTLTVNGIPASKSNLSLQQDGEFIKGILPAGDYHFQ